MLFLIGYTVLRAILYFSTIILDIKDKPDNDYMSGPYWLVVGLPTHF